MTSRWIALWIIIVMNTVGDCLKCFECESTENPACGVDFKSYQYEPNSCTEAQDPKCGLQRQPKTADGRIHILRACYYLGQLPGMNESDGCHFITLGVNVTLEFCLCTTDLCNVTSLPVSSVLSMTVCASILFAIIQFCT